MKSDTEDALDSFLHEIKVVADRSRQDRRVRPPDYFYPQDHEFGREGNLGNGRLIGPDGASELDDSDPGSEWEAPFTSEPTLMHCSPSSAAGTGGENRFPSYNRNSDFPARCRS